MKLFQNFSGRAFFRAVSILLVLYVISYFFAFARADGAEGAIFSIMTAVAVVLGLPFVWLCTIIVHLIHPLFLFTAAAADILLYAFLIERAVTYLNSKKTSKAV